MRCPGKPAEDHLIAAMALLFEPRLHVLLGEAGVEDRSASSAPSSSLVGLAEEALRLAGVTQKELSQIEALLAESKKTSAVALGIGGGFAAWSLTQSGPLFQKAIENGMKIGKFVAENFETLTAGWSEALPEVAEFATELVLKLPSGSVALGLQLLELDSTIDAALDLSLEWGVEIGKAFELAGVTAEMLGLADVATSFGAGIAAGWLVKKGVEAYYAPILEEKQERLEALRKSYMEILKLRQALRAELPCVVISGQLRKVDPRYWEID